MKAEIYPQPLDTFGATLKQQGEYGELYSKYKVDELRGYAKQKFDEFNQGLQFLSKKLAVHFIILLVVSVIAFTLFIGLLEGSSEVGFAKAYSNVPYLFWALGGVLIITAVVFILFMFKYKNYRINLAELNDTLGNEVERLVQSAFNLPTDAQTIFVFRRAYRTGKVKPSAVYAQQLIAFVKNDSVYICFDGALLAIPKRDCFAVEMVEQKIGYVDATGEINYKDPEVKRYKSAKNDNGQLFFKCFGRLMFSANGQTWALDVLPFSFDATKKLFGKE